MTDYIMPRGKLGNHLDRIYQIAQGERPPPVNVEIDLSLRCNFGCDFCHFAHTHTRGPLSKTNAPANYTGAGDLIQHRLALSILDQIKEAGVRSVVWSGGGEPTLHPQFRQIITHCELPQGLYTNGSLMNTNLGGLLKRRMEWVYVSLDAHAANEHAALKQISTLWFGNIERNVKALVAAPGDATVGLGFMLTRHNYQHAPRMVELAREWGVDYVQFRPAIAYQQNNPTQPAESTGWAVEAIQVLKPLAFDPLTNVDITRFKMYYEWRGHHYPVCWFAGLQTVITPDGRLWTCVNKRGYEGEALGDLSAEPFADIWGRGQLPAVNGQCRVMCRGHLPNVGLQPVMTKASHHEDFI